MTQMSQMSLLLQLPLELRNEIYTHLLKPEANRTFDPESGLTRYHFDHLNLLLVSKQIYNEAQSVFYLLNEFARVKTPFRDAERHITMEGHVPVVASQESAENIKCRVSVEIEAPDYTHQTEFSILVLHVDDIGAFSDMWFYSALTYEGLNRQMALTLANLQKDKDFPKSLQKKFFLPFRSVKELQWVQFRNIDFDIEKEVRQGMAKPYDSPQHCLEEATKIKNDGNKAFQEKKYHKAIDLYIQSFKAMHIVCRGHQRSVWAEMYFRGIISSGTYEGQDATQVRMALRVKLVANICQTYLKLEDYENTFFWGNRTIMILRDSMFNTLDEEEEGRWILSFPAASELGKIYYRTGMAEKMRGNRSEARSLLRIARVVLPNDEHVKQALASVALQLG
jgi:hypothetical protein